MNTGPGQPDREPLTPEEREWAQRLTRLGPSAGPPSAVDARILAAAHDAVAARPRPRKPRPWPIALGVAASLVLAVGIAWQLRPMQEPLPARGEAEIATDRASGGPAPPPEPVAAPAPMGVAPPPLRDSEHASAKQLRKSEAPAVPEEPPIALDESRAAAAVMAPPAAPPPPPAPAPAAEAEAAASAAAANADMAADAAASVQESERTREAVDAAAAQRTQPQASPGALPQAAFRREAQKQNSATEEQVDIVGSDAGDEPPAYANSPQVRDAWLRRIRELIAEGNLQQAHDSLDEFKRRYPEHPLPEDLKQFEQSKHGSLIP